MQNNDWYERGERPPVGSVVLVKNRGEKGEVKCHLKLGSFIVEFENGEIQVLKREEVSPFRNERDVLVERMRNDTESAKEKYNITTDAICGVIGDLIDAGWRPIKQMTEEQFIGATSGYYSEEASRNLYRAGCRFIDTD